MRRKPHGDFLHLAGAMEMSNIESLMRISITPLTSAHYPRVREIYKEGIASDNATFQTDTPSWESFDEAHLATCRLVALDDSENIVGWAALTPVSKRPVYAGVCEVSVYVAAATRGQGVGRALLSALIESSEADGRWTLQAGIFPENVASVALHLRHGFRIVGTRERIGQLRGVWRDVLLLERRRQDDGPSMSAFSSQPAPRG